MQAAHRVMHAGAAQRDTVAGILAAAFARDPVMNWVIPHAGLYRPFFDLLLRDVFLPRGTVQLEQAGRGAALWLPPGERFEVPPSAALLGLVLRLALRRGPRTLLRIREQGALFARQHPHAPHFHLLFIGCPPEHQGRGVGSTLLRAGTRLCDAARMPAYLESSNARNLPLYRGHGFEVVAAENLPEGGPRVWFMWREPR